MPPGRRGAAIAAMLMLAATPATAATLTIDVTNVRGETGRVHVDICHQAEFLKKCAIIAESHAVKGQTVLTIENLPPGDYAVQASYDENGNGKVDRGLFGVPKEGVGFSNDAPIKLGPPKWADAQFRVDADRTITLKLRYLLGGDGK